MTGVTASFKILYNGVIILSNEGNNCRGDESEYRESQYCLAVIPIFSNYKGD